MRTALLRKWASRRREKGYAAILVAMLVPTVFLGLAALAVDTARWYSEIERVQKAADAAALAGVTYMPNDVTAAKAKAIAVATVNGFTTGGVTTVVAEEGAKPSQLKVTITTTLQNVFGDVIGTPTAAVSRSAVADFTAPSPMGSPCNTFGNEPPSQAGAATANGDLTTALPPVGTRFANCSSTPQFWAAMEGQNTQKVQGDRYQAKACTDSGNAGAPFGCAAGVNTEYRPDGYFFTVHVEPGAINSPIDVQIYDPAFVYTGVYCSTLPTNTDLANNMNPYTTTDGRNRYSRLKSTNGNTTYNAAAQAYCAGDSNPGNSGGTSDPVTTSFALRRQTDTNNPMNGALISGCTKQFRGFNLSTNATTVQNQLTSTHTSYNANLAQVFHQWVSLCTFTPDVAGDYYIQVRTNVSVPATPASQIIFTGNAAVGAATGNTTTGTGSNSFTMRAVPTNNAHKTLVSVSGYERMPILQTATSSTATFNLVRALPQARGQYIAFDFFDGGDSQNGGTVRVIAPSDATGSIKATSNIPGCRYGKNDLAPASYSTTTTCTAPVVGTNTDGQVIHMVIPLPNDYNCNPATLGGCWFQVQLAFSGNVTDFTTWSATVGGDPVRLIE